jgi:hypothetical protein
VFGGRDPRAFPRPAGQRGHRAQEPTGCGESPGKDLASFPTHSTVEWRRALISSLAMVSRLSPSEDHYKESHPGWVEHIANLVRAAEGGTVLGLYGRWGSGKSSAVMAVLREVLSRSAPGDADTRTLGTA